ncbi:MAG: T9SS type A sorting domain-containing protein [Bacteroidales bacterium]|nr:T9SS type A sorting domain-containing protein [Bacteroidales bacterium]
MKKISLIIVALFAFSFANFAQQVEREFVILEIATGTWCQYCPGAAMGADDLIENGHDVAVIEYHGGDEYQNSFSSSRINYYNVNSYPTSIFDGVSTVAGGSNNESMYSSFLPKYNQRKAINSSFTINAEGSCDGLQALELTVTAEKVADYSGNNIALFCVVTESEIEDSWQGQTHLNFVERTMLPNANGTTVDFSESNTTTVDLSALLDETWNYDHLEVVIFLQDKTTKEILQGYKAPITDFTSNLSFDASLKAIENVAEQSCSGTASPRVTISNLGQETLTSVDIHYSVNDGEEMISNWTGSLNYRETEDVQLDEITFDIQDNYIIKASTTNPNGNPDEYENNNERSLSFESAQTTSKVSIIMRTDSHPEETTWEILNSSGEVVDAGGPYDAPNTFVLMNHEFTTATLDCYSFVLYDAGGDGFTNSNSMLIINDHNAETIYQGRPQGGTHEIQFTIDLNDAVPTVENINNVQVYPNPVNDQTQVYFNLTTQADINMSVYDAYGKQVSATDFGSQSVGSVVLPVDLSGQSSGVYFIRIQSGNTFTTQRVIVK